MVSGNAHSESLVDIEGVVKLIVNLVIRVDVSVCDIRDGLYQVDPMSYCTIALLQ